MTTSAAAGRTAPTWWPDAAVALGVGLFGTVEAFATTYSPILPRVLLALMLAGAAGCFRRVPGLSLGLAWGAAVVQLFLHVDPMVVEVSVALVAFGCGRYGSTLVVWLSGLSIPFVTVLGALWVIGAGSDLVYLLSALRNGRAVPLPTSVIVALVPFALFGLALPWLVGLGLRLLVRSRASQQAAEEQQHLAETRQAEAERDRARAEEIAQLRAGQARLARDVHDVVGHSLAVILAQAEAAQFLEDADTEKMREVMGNVADSARRSLQDVRHVLSSTGADGGVPSRSEGLDALVEGVRAAGNDVRTEVVGTPVPLPPELDVVAYRVLQEMLTNALKHGRRGAPVRVEQVWADRWSSDELRLEVRNEVEAVDLTQPIQVAGRDAAAPGMGLASMRQRLESVGGRLDVRLREGVFTATAWLPLRAGELA